MKQSSLVLITSSLTLALGLIGCGGASSSQSSAARLSSNNQSGTQAPPSSAALVSNPQITGPALADYRSLNNLEKQIQNAGGNINVVSSLGTQFSSYFYWNNGVSLNQRFNTGSSFLTTLPLSTQNATLVSQYLSLGTKLMAETGIDANTMALITDKMKAVQAFVNFNAGQLVQIQEDTFDQDTQSVSDAIQTLANSGIAVVDLNQSNLIGQKATFDSYVAQQTAAGQTMDAVKLQILQAIDQTAQTLDSYLAQYGHGFLLADDINPAREVSVDAGKGSREHLASIENAIKFQAFLVPVSRNVKAMNTASSTQTPTQQTR